MEPTHQHQAQAQAAPPLALIDKEEETKLVTPKESEVPATEITKIIEENKNFKTDEAESKNLIQVSEPNLTTAEASEITETASVIDTPVKEEIKEAELPEPEIAPTATKVTGAVVDTGTTELVEEPSNLEEEVEITPVSLVSGTGVAPVTQNLEEETNEIKHATEGSMEAELPDPSVTATSDCSTGASPDTEIVEEDKGVELVKEEIKAGELHDATSVFVSDVKPVTETTEKAEDAEPKHEEETKEVKLPHATPGAETQKESANLELEFELPEVETEGPKLQDISVAAAAGDEGTETELVKEEIKKPKLPDSSLAATPVADTELIPGTETSEATAVQELRTENESAVDVVKVENCDTSSTVLAESEVTQVLVEKKREKKPLGAHLAEEKANDSVNANKQAPDQNSEVDLPEKECTGVCSRDLSTTQDATKIEAGENKEDDKVVENAADEVAAVEVAQEGGKESVEPAKAAKEEIASKLSSRNSNNILSKVKHQIVKVKKAIVRKSPSSKNMHADAGRE